MGIFGTRLKDKKLLDAYALLQNAQEEINDLEMAFRNHKITNAGEKEKTRQAGRQNSYLKAARAITGLLK